jgi:hypothetical protein
MTIIVATRDFIAADSRLSFGDDDASLTVGKIFKRRGGGLFATAGDSRLTNAFEEAMKAGRRPKPLEVLEDECFEAVLLTPQRELICYDVNFAPFPFGEAWLALGGPRQVARSWLMNGADPVGAIRRCIEVDRGCGFPILIAHLDGSHELIEQ